MIFSPCIDITQLVLLVVRDLHSVLVVRNNVSEPEQVKFHTTCSSAISPISCNILGHRGNGNIAADSLLLWDLLKLPHNLPLRQLRLEEVSNRLLWYLGRRVESIGETLREDVRPRAGQAVEVCEHHCAHPSTARLPAASLLPRAGSTVRLVGLRRLEGPTFTGYVQTPPEMNLICVRF